MAHSADKLNFSGSLEGGLFWDELTRKRMRNSKALEKYGYKVYPQNGEDGIKKLICCQ